MGPSAQTSTSRSSTNRINVLLCRAKSKASKVPDTAFLPWLTQANSLEKVETKIAANENPMPVVNAAYQHLDKDTAPKFTSQLNMLKTQWQKNKISQDEIVKIASTIKSDHVDKHCEILSKIDAEPEVNKIIAKLQSNADNETLNTNRAMDESLITKINQWKNERNRLRNSIQSLANETLNWEQEKTGLEAKITTLYQNMLSSGIPTNVLNKLPATPSSRQFR